MEIEHFFDKNTFTITYVVFDRATKDAVVIDPVMDFDLNTNVVNNQSLLKLINFLERNSLKPHYCLETHAHADHLSSSHFLKDKFPSLKIAISEKIQIVQKSFKKILDLNSDFPTSGHQFDQLLSDNDFISAGSLIFKAIATPGHTPACMSYLIEKSVFTGDALFIEDSGTGRCDFPDGSAYDLYQSVHGKLYELPDDTEVFVGHDYQPGGRALRFKTTIGASKVSNIQLKSHTSEEDFVHFRMERDKTLNPPKLLIPSLRVNINAGKLPQEIKRNS